MTILRDLLTWRGRKLILTRNSLQIHSKGTMQLGGRVSHWGLKQGGYCCGKCNRESGRADSKMADFREASAGATGVTLFQAAPLSFCREEITGCSSENRLIVDFHYILRPTLCPLRCLWHGPWLL